MDVRKAVGDYGERVAERFLTDHGMTVLDRKWSCPAGEIDLVLRDGDALVICEVKTRRGDEYGGPLVAVTPTKLSRLRRLAVLWLAEQQLRVPEIRIDVVAIQRGLRGAATVDHIRGAA